MSIIEIREMPKSITDKYLSIIDYCTNIEAFNERAGLSYR